MGQTRLLKFSKTERMRLERLLSQTKDARNSRRIVAILKIEEGDSPDLVAEALDVNLVTVYRWIERYKRQRRGADLLDRRRSGRPSSLRRLNDREIDQLLGQSPQTYGYTATAWTVTLLRSHIQRHFDISVSDETMRRWLHQREYRWKRPRYVFHQTDPRKGQKKGASSQP